MKPTLNQADIELLKGTFATKEDIKSLKNQITAEFEQEREILANSFNDIESRLSKVENILSIKPAN